MNERRSYLRDSESMASAKISWDGKKWDKVTIHDISAGGLSFHSAETFEAGDVLWFDLLLSDFAATSEFDIFGTIRRVQTVNKGFIYGVSFDNAEEKVKIQIDEMLMYKKRIEEKNSL